MSFRYSFEFYFLTGDLLKGAKQRDGNWGAQRERESYLLTPGTVPGAEETDEQNIQKFLLLCSWNFRQIGNKLGE